MLNSHDYSISDDEPTVPSFRIDLRRGKIVNQFGTAVMRKKQWHIGFHATTGITLGFHLNVADRYFRMSFLFWDLIISHD